MLALVVFWLAVGGLLVSCRIFGGDGVMFLGSKCCIDCNVFLC